MLVSINFIGIVDPLQMSKSGKVRQRRSKYYNVIEITLKVFY